MPERLGKYLTAVYGAMIVMAAILATLVYGVLKNDDVQLDDIVVELADDGSYYINPGSGSFPDSPPEFVEPLSPPPTD